MPYYHLCSASKRGRGHIVPLCRDAVWSCMIILPIYSSAINMWWLDTDYLWKSVSNPVQHFRISLCQSIFFFDTLRQAMSCLTFCTKLISWWCGFYCYLTLCAEVLLHLQDSRSICTESVWPFVEGPKWRWNMNSCNWQTLHMYLKFFLLNWIIIIINVISTM